MTFQPSIHDDTLLVTLHIHSCHLLCLAFFFFFLGKPRLDCTKVYEIRTVRIIHGFLGARTKGLLALK